MMSCRLYLIGSAQSNSDSGRRLYHFLVYPALLELIVQDEMDDCSLRREERYLNVVDLVRVVGDGLV